MATTAIWSVKGDLGQVVNYAANPDKTTFSQEEWQGLHEVMDYATQNYKTEEQRYVSGVNCTPEIAKEQMGMVKRQFGKEGGIVAFHGYQSFAPGEVTPKQAHEIGLELAKRLWGDRFQVVVATHLDREHIHNHFVLNPVSFRDGKKFNDCKATYALMRRTSDELCREHHQFQMAGFDKRRLFYTQGDYGLWQCSWPCHRETYDNEAVVRRMWAEQRDMRVPGELIPRCPRCGKPMTMNLRVDDAFVQDKGWYRAAERYEEFLQRQGGRRLLLLELGVGMNTPGIIKYPFWRLTEQVPEVTYVCINAGMAGCPEGISRRSVCIDGDIAMVIQEWKRGQ